MPQVLSTEFSGAAALRMSAYEQFLRLIDIGRLLADGKRSAYRGLSPVDRRVSTKYWQSQHLRIERYGGIPYFVYATRWQPTLLLQSVWTTSTQSPARIQAALGLVGSRGDPVNCNLPSMKES
jgi:hypothetical protein